MNLFLGIPLHLFGLKQWCYNHTPRSPVDYQMHRHHMHIPHYIYSCSIVQYMLFLILLKIYPQVVILYRHISSRQMLSLFFHMYYFEQLFHLHLYIFFYLLVDYRCHHHNHIQPYFYQHKNNLYKKNRIFQNY